MASLSNINGLFDVHSTGAILFSTSHGLTGQILRSNGDAAPTWIDFSSTGFGGDYLLLTGGVLTGNLTINGTNNLTVGGTVGITGLLTGTTGSFSGLVSGITPTAAANFATKGYVDGLTPGTGVFLPLAGGALTGATSITVGTNTTTFSTTANQLIIKNSYHASASGLALRSSNDTHCMQLYGEAAAYGFLASEWGAWNIRKVVSGGLYLNDNNTYFVQPEGTSNMNAATFAGNVAAPTFNGLAINTSGTNNVANQIVRTDVNGYANFGWINSISGATTSTITRITASSDAYLRYVTPATFRTQITDPYYAPTGTVSGVTSVATGTGLTGGTITTTGTLSIDSTVATLAGQQVFTGNKYFNNFFLEFNSKTLANFNDLNNNQFEVSMYDVYNLAAASTGMLSTYGTLFQINGRISHTKTQFAFNGGNDNLQYRTSWYPNTAWTSFRQIWDSDNLPSPVQSSGVTSVATSNGITGGTITTTGTLSVDTTVIRTTGDQSMSGIKSFTGAIATSSTQTRNKISVWSDTTNYTIGMMSGYTFGGLSNEYAMSFQMNDNNGRGFWWGDTGHTNAQGAMSLTTQGVLAVAGSLKLGFGESDTTAAAYTLQANGTVYSANGNTAAFICGPNTSYGAGTELEIGGWTAGTTVSRIRNSNGNLHMDSKSGHQMYLNHYPAGNILTCNGGGYLMSYQSVRSPIFYDLDNTGYYVNPNATSQLSSLNCNAGITINGSENLYLTTNYGQSIVGLYSSTKYQGIFAMGNAYKLPIDGSGTGTLYGICYSHPNAGGVAANLSDHGMLLLQSGVYRAAISGSIRCITDMRTPIYYDSDNTGYYLNPASTSNLNTVTAAQFNGPLTGNATSATTATNLSGAGGSSIRSTSTGVSYQNNYQIRENTGGSGNTSEIYAPQIAFHWGSVVASSIMCEASGRIAIRNNPGTSYEDFIADISYANTSSNAPIFYDSSNTAYYINPAGINSSSFEGVSDRTRAQLGLSGGTWNSGSTYMRRPNYTADTKYWTGAMGWSTVDMNTVASWGSGFVDSWSSPANAPSGSSHWVGTQVFHYNNGSTTNYGWQLVSGGGVQNLRFRQSWPTFTAWRTVPVLDVNNANGGAMYAGIYYDSDNTANYVDPAGTSRLLNLDFGVAGYYLKAGSWGVRNQTPYGYIEFGPANSSYGHIYTDRPNFYMNAGLYINGGSWMRTGDIRSAIFYDVDNTAFYLDASSTGTSLNVAGDVVGYSSSDIRYKDNVKPIENALDKIDKIKGYTFEWNELSHKQTGKKDIGVIAQEVEEILPEIIDTRDNGYKAVDYPKLTALLIQSVKEQQIIINDLKSRIEKLEL